MVLCHGNDSDVIKPTLQFRAGSGMERIQSFLVLDGIIHVKMGSSLSSKFEVIYGYMSRLLAQSLAQT